MAKVAPGQVRLPSVTGIVKDIMGKGMAEADVGIRSRASTQWIKTDAKGHFAFASLPPGEYGIDASKEGYNGTSQRITVQPGRVTSLELTLRQMATGTVASMTGSSITLLGRIRGKTYKVDDPPDRLTFAITEKTRIVGAPPSPGNAVRIVFRTDQTDQTNIAVEIEKMAGGVGASPVPSRGRGDRRDGR